MQGEFFGHNVCNISVALMLVVSFIALASNSHATSFLIQDGETVTVQQVLDGDGETGIIELGGALQTGSDTAISAGGNSILVINSGSIGTQGYLADGIVSTGNNASITNSGSISTEGGDASAIVSTGNNATITNSGSIGTQGYRADGIYSSGINTTITNSGIISTQWYQADGIYSYGINAIITNSGSIGTEGAYANGIVSYGIDAIITNSGSISTIGSTGDGVRSFRDNVTITNSGSIGTQGFLAAGISSAGNNATLTNLGSISTQGKTSGGIRSAGNNATLTNSGSISTQGSSADGIRSHGIDAIITNSGSIGTQGYSAEGIYITNDNATLTNSGIISTQGIDSDGIYSAGNNATLTNLGSISTQGEAAHSIYSGYYVDATITNSGSISTQGYRADGIFSYSIDATITNSGSIGTQASSADGIYSRGINTTITNSGSISTEGAYANGIVSTGDNATITNSGLISATGSGSFAILGGNGTQTVNVQPGSYIIGPIDLGPDDDVANIYGHGVVGSAVLNFENTEAINVFAPNAWHIDSTDTVVIIDPTGESVLGNTLNAFTTGVHNVINQRMQHTPALKPVKLASLELSPGMLYQERAPVLWGQFFGQKGDRDSEGQMLAYDHDYHGFVGGYERDYEGGRVGLLAGGARADTDGDAFAHDTDSVFIGIYGHAYLGKVNLTASFLAGLEDHDAKRQVFDNVNGYETAKSDRDSYFLSPSITVSSAYILNPEVELRPSATLTYTMGRYDSYQETGTTNSNLNVDSRTVDAFATRLQLESAKMIEGGEVNLRVGAQSRHTGGDDIAGNLGAANFKYSAASDSDVAGGFVGVGVQQQIKDKLSVFADLEYGRFSGDEKYLTGQVTLEYRF